MPSGKSAKAKPRKRQAPALGDILTRAGIIFIALACALGLAVLWPVILEELGYTAKQLAPALSQPEITPIDRSFGIVIPKLGANARVIPNVDPFNSRLYQQALTRGVAHAKGTSVPGEMGNIFLFSHSSVNFYEASRYNSVFYLLTKMEVGDTVDLYYQGDKYTYAVTSKQTVSPTAVQYLKPLDKGREIVTLMTCWPPGTTYKRLLVIAERRK